MLQLQLLPPPLRLLFFVVDGGVAAAAAAAAAAPLLPHARLRADSSHLSQGRKIWT